MKKTYKLALPLLMVFSLNLAAAAPSFKDVKVILEKKCLDCHDSDMKKGNVNLELMLDQETFDKVKNEKLWIKIDRAITSGDMPPKKKKPLVAEAKKTILSWFYETYVLDNGKENIGYRTVRRLTRYELENTLEDLLHIELKYPYVWSYEFPSMVKSYIEEAVPQDIQGVSGFRNDANQLQKSSISMNKMISYIHSVIRIFANSPKAQKAFFGKELTKKKYTNNEVKSLLIAFMDKAYRGHSNSQTKNAVFKAYVSHRKKKQNSYSSLLHAFKIALLSPSFLYHMEDSKNSSTRYKITGVDLANRLSYFLWSSMPDKELLDLGKSEKLSNETVLRKQVSRMLNSEKRLALSENFAGQWLGFESLKTDKRFYKSESWNRGIYDEMLFFFDELIKSDRSILDIINSDWTYKSRYTKIKVNTTRGKNKKALYEDIFSARRKRPGRLEKFYDPPSFKNIKDGKLGGMLTLNGVMRLTSAPDRTSPIRRGVWMTEVIIGRHMEAPENVPPLSDSEKADTGKKLTRLVDILKAHTNKAACISCHQHIDPLGMGLENFGPFGDYRTSYKDKQDIISNGKLPNGKTFDTPTKLKILLLEHYKDDIVKNVIKRMMSYAYAKELHPNDRITLKAIHKKMSENNYSMNTLIYEIIKSKQFQFRKDQP
ncbi:MAG: DUF1592 domain-containing protein [Lentisphaeraceae bacterium]|nr:DUF1592 domain-containing protein [Lentisphaeraceae bacterium]